MSIIGEIENIVTGFGTNPDQYFQAARNYSDKDDLWLRDRVTVYNALKADELLEEYYEDEKDEGIGDDPYNSFSEYVSYVLDSFFLGAIGNYKGADFVVWSNIADLDGMHDVLIVREGDDIFYKTIQTN